MKRPEPAGSGLVALALFLLSAPLSAQPVQPDSGRAAVAAALGRAVTAARMDDCRGVLSALDPVVASAREQADRAMVQRMRMPCLAATGRDTDVKTTYAELQQLLPRDGLVRTFGILIATSESRFADAAEQLAALAESDPASLRLVTGSNWRGIAQKLTEQTRYDLRDRVYIALARADWEPQDQPELRDSVAQGAIEALVGRKEIDEAGRLLDRIDMPELLVGMAIERRYESLWPTIEARLGPAGADAIDRFAREKLDGFARTPDDERAQRDAIRAFVLLGRPEEAIEMGERITVADGMSDEAVTAIRYEAQALIAAGQRDRAIERLGAVARLDTARTPSAGTALVVHAEMLDEAGRTEEALAAARVGLTTKNGSLSPWGVAWLERTEACALSAMARTDDANRAVAPLAADPSRNQAAAIEALLCLGRLADAETIAVAALSNPQEASLIADQFQPDGALGWPMGSRLRALWEPLLARPKVKAAFTRAARILPRNLWPAREPRPIPRTQRPFDGGPIA